MLRITDNSRETPLDSPSVSRPQSAAEDSGVSGTSNTHSTHARDSSFTEIVAETGLRVLHVIDRLDVGGTELGIARVIRGLNGGFQHRVCAIRGFNEEFIQAQALTDKVCVAGHPTTGFQLAVGRLARVMREFKPSVVHSRNWGAIEAIPAARLARVPVAIHSEHGYEVDMLAGLPLHRRIVRRMAYTAADLIFTVSEELRNFHAHQAWFPAERIHVLRNGVDTVKFCPRPSVRAQLRRQLGLTEDCIACGSVGRLVAIKDHATLLQATKKLLERGVPLCLFFAGTGPELVHHEQLVAASPELSKRVKFIGLCTDVPAFLNALDIFVLPSLSEGMSNTLLEAMAVGLPVVASKVGGNPEIIREDSVGRLFNAGDVAGLTSLLEQLIRYPVLRQKLGLAARKLVEEQFSLENMIDRYHDLYLGLFRARVPER